MGRGGAEICPSKRVGAQSAPSGGSVRTWFSVFLKVATRWRVRWDNDTPSDFACDGNLPDATRGLQGPLLVENTSRKLVRGEPGGGRRRAPSRDR